MKYAFSALLWFMLLFNFFGCATITFNSNYQLSLSGVSHPKNETYYYGNQKIDTVTDNPKYNYFFEDSLVKILWLADSRQITFSIENKTDYIIKILWDDAAYVDENNHSHRVIHSGIKFNDRANPQPPSVIAPKGIIDDFVFPADYIQFIPGNENTAPAWVEQSLIPVTSEKHVITESSLDEAQAKFNDSLKVNIGKNYQVLLPLQIDNTLHEYIFTFTIENAASEIE